MEHKHIAFVSVPAHGHVNPSLALVAELTRRGHRVTYTINDEFAGTVTAAGATPVLYESTFPSDNDPNSDWPEDEAGGLKLFTDECFATFDTIEAAYNDDRPDVFVYDIGGFAAPILGDKWGIPAIQLSPTFVAYEGFEEDFGMDGEPSPALAAVHREFDDFLAAQGVSITRDEVLGKPRRCVVALPRTWQLHGDKVADRYTFVGPLIDDRAHQGDWTAPDDRPVLLISLGSAYTDRLDFYRDCVTAFADLDWHVLLSVGRFIEPSALGEVPSNFEVVQRVPQVRVLQQASAFITHAGMGSTMEGLTFGVPMVAVPQAVDQFMNGHRLAELELGAHVAAEDVTPEKLREAVLHVSSDATIAANLKAMREEIAAAGGASAAADVVERA
ncbi:MGT family glycosyltransferase [Herbihabitans rhizosphaerae]|uniref:MGT family glycosyltransferase n=1 Tax=Herbihabitans rhizosphaerae TaxID=1872711 RepID=A0A4Q7L7D7_9PSEU|nr:macrolide family glycosyltransferase [Herbihabitans rhizosphaerae]RZS45184.1 MGT family glycosyltransferase [Herbihabitans rhizosphaerae]